MKQKIFSKGNGWYISCSNYKDEKDKAYINLFFPKNTEPFYQDNGRGFSVKDIDIQEAKFTSYKGKVGMTIFKYEELSDLPITENNMTTDENTYKGDIHTYAPYEMKGASSTTQIVLNDGEKDMFGGEPIVDEDDLPFY